MRGVSSGWLAPVGVLVLSVGAAVGFAGPAETVVAAQEQGVLHGSVTIAWADAEREAVTLHAGVRDTSAEEPIENDGETRYRIASLTKLVTQLAVLRLVDAGEVDLDEPIGTYRPELRAGWADEVRVRDLLSMRAGLPRELHRSPERGVEFDRDGRAGAYLDRRLRRLDLESEPGEREHYSNVGYWLLGAMIEGVTGETYVDAVNALVCEPLGVEGLAFSAERLEGAHARGHQGDDVVGQFDIATRYSSGGLCATSGQFAAIASGMLRDGFLEDETRDLLFNGFGTERGEDELMIAGMVPGFMNLVLVDREHGVVVVSLNNRVARDPNAFMGAVREIFDETCQAE
ncbi:MAG: beta-lactamase family protein [Phycisphaerales bacterium]|nr:beta-lactamase family protein [Phycisphaerales bacterium]